MHGFRITSSLFKSNLSSKYLRMHTKLYTPKKKNVFNNKINQYESLFNISETVMMQKSGIFKRGKNIPAVQIIPVCQTLAS